MRLLILDTCGAVGSVALVRDDGTVCVKTMAERAASAQLLRVIDAALAEAGWTRSDIEAVGVVSGPGSFTGVRVGLAAAKGLCEALQVPMAAVSRLEVLQEAAGGGAVAMEAGRGEAFVRTEDGIEHAVALSGLSDVAVCESSLAAKVARSRVVTIDASSATRAVLRCLAAGASDVASADANYVRGEAQMYRTKAVA